MKKAKSVEPTITAAVKTYLKSCPALASAARILVNELDNAIGSFAIDPLPGARTISTDLDGTKTKEWPFAVTSTECTADEASRLAAHELYEKFVLWLEKSSDDDHLPALGSKRTAERIEATTWAFLFRREHDASRAIYQINCRLTYTEGG